MRWKNAFFEEKRTLDTCTALVKLPDVLNLIDRVFLDSKEHEGIAIFDFQGFSNILEQFR